MEKNGKDKSRTEEISMNLKEHFPSLHAAGFMEHLEGGNVEGVLNIIDNNCLDNQIVKDAIDNSVIDLGVAIGQILTGFDIAEEASEMVKSFRDLVLARVGIPTEETLKRIKEYRDRLVKKSSKK